MAFGAGLTRGAQLLTHRTIETLRPAEAPYRVPDQRCKGLAVRVALSGVKTWDLAYRIRGTGKMRRLSLGRRTPSMGIALDLVAAISGHESGGKDTRTLVRHYARTDLLERKAHALLAWEERLRTIVAGEEDSKVLHLTRVG